MTPILRSGGANHPYTAECVLIPYCARGDWPLTGLRGFWVCYESKTPAKQALKTPGIAPGKGVGSTQRQRYWSSEPRIEYMGITTAIATKPTASATVMVARGSINPTMPFTRSLESCW